MRKFVYIALFIAVLSFFLGRLCRADGKGMAQKITKNIEAKAEGISSYTANVTMIAREKGLEQDFKGKAFFKAPDKQKTECYNTDKSLNYLTIIKDKKVWQYFPSSNKVFYADFQIIEKFIDRYPFLFSVKSIPDMLGKGLFDNIKNIKYAGSQALDGKTAYILKAEAVNKIPLFGPGRAGEKFYAKDIILWVGADDGILYKRLRKDEFSEISFTEIYDNVVVNVPIEDKEFEFILPEKADFTDRTGEIKKTFLAQAVSYFSKALEADPDDDTIHGNLVFLYEERGDIEEAKKELKITIKLFREQGRENLAKSAEAYLEKLEARH